MEWAKSSQTRDQLVLFPTRLDEAVGPNHRVRLLDEILGQIDWSVWEAAFNLRRGQPPIHPRILASVILYGLLVRIRSSRKLEEALEIRLDFRWLVEGRTIDHSTISEFRRKNSEAIKGLFVQIAMIAREMGCLPLQTLAFDGTRIRANNRRSGTRTPEKLRELKEALQKKFDELEAKANAEDQQEDELLGDDSAHTVADELADVNRRQQQINAALSELERIEQSGETEPNRLPLTDPESRVMPNKYGGFAPNFTPTATVDVDSGMVVSADVLPNINEDKELVTSIQDVQEKFGVATPPIALADGLMSTGENLALCKENGIELFSPIKGQNDKDNPAVREDPTQPVPAADRDRLPKQKVTRNGQKQEQLDKRAFVYDKEADSYWCPEGKSLPYTTTTTEKRNGGHRIRRRYVASAGDCVQCPLKSLCVQGKAKSRMINREQHESVREEHVIKMSTDEAQKQYSRRRHAGERPFAVIKHQFGARQFLLRGLSNVRKEWNWLLAAFNLSQLIGLKATGIGPPSK